MAYYLNAVTKTRLAKLQELSLFCVLLTIPLFRFGSAILGTQSLTPAKIFMGITFAIWMVNILWDRDIAGILTLIQEKANILILLFLAITFISLINARYFENEAFQELSLRVKMLILYFLIFAIIKDRRSLKAAIFVFIIGSIFTTGVGLYELATGKSFFAESYRYGYISQKMATGLAQTTYGGAGRVQGLYSDPGFHAHAIVIFFGLTIPWLFYARSKKIKILASILITCYAMNVIGTGARVGWVSLAFSFLIFLLVIKHRYKYVVGPISILLVILIFLALFRTTDAPTFERLQYGKDKSFSWRLDTYRQGIEMVRDHPLLGVGTGNYLAEYHNYLSETPNLSRYFMGWLHNSYLQIWAENGTIGLGVFLIFFLTIFFGLLTAYLNAVDVEMKALSLGLLTAFSGYAVEFSGVPILGQEPGWIILGLSAAFISIFRKEREEART